MPTSKQENYDKSSDGLDKEGPSPRDTIHSFESASKWKKKMKCIIQTTTTELGPAGVSAIATTAIGQSVGGLGGAFAGGLAGSTI